MIPTPSRRIDGDVTVGRHVIAGGDANVQGNARVGHNLIVEGWLEAKNIKGVNKGLFATVTALREAYPHPHDGWFAGVSASDKDISDLGLTVQQGKALFRMYVGSGGDWVCEPVNKLYEIVVDDVHLREDLSTLCSRHENLEKRVDGHDVEIDSIKTQQAALERSIITVQEETDAAIKAITDSKGMPNGIATLGDDGRVPLSQLPVGQLKDVVEFDGFEMLAFAPAIEQGSATGEGEVLFLASTDTFVFRAAGMPAKYYANWDGAEAYGEFSDRGRVPSGGKLYLDVSTNTQYRWDVETLVATGSHLELGETAGTAYAGDKGEKLRADVEALAKDVDRVAEQLPVIVFDGIITDEQDLDSLPAGFYFHAGQNRFGYSEGAAQSWDPDGGNNGNTAEDRASCLFRCGVRLYHFVDDSMFELVDSERLDEMRAEIIDEVMTRLQGL